MNDKIDAATWERVWQRVSQSGQTERAQSFWEEMLCQKRASIIFWQKQLQTGAYSDQTVFSMLQCKKKQWKILKVWYYLETGNQLLCRRQSGTDEPSMHLCLRQQYLLQLDWAAKLQRMSEQTDSEVMGKSLRCAAGEDAAHAEVIRKLLLQRMSVNERKHQGRRPAAVNQTDYSSHTDHLRGRREFPGGEKIR